MPTKGPVVGIFTSMALISSVQAHALRNTWPYGVSWGEVYTWTDFSTRKVGTSRSTYGSLTLIGTLCGDRNAKSLHLKVLEAKHDPANRKNIAYWNASVQGNGQVQWWVQKNAGLVIQDYQNAMNDPWHVGKLLGPDRSSVVIPGLRTDGALFVLTKPMEIAPNVQIGLGRQVKESRRLVFGRDSVFIIDALRRPVASEVWIAGDGLVVIEKGTQLYVDDRRLVTEHLIFGPDFSLQGQDNLTIFDTKDPTWMGYLARDGTVTSLRMQHSGPLARLATRMWGQVLQDNPKMPAHSKTWLRKEIGATKELGIALESMASQHLQARTFRHELRNALRDLTRLGRQVRIAQNQWQRQVQVSEKEEKDWHPILVTVDIRTSDAEETFDLQSTSYESSMDIQRNRMRAHGMVSYDANSTFGVQLQGSDRDVKIQGLARESTTSAHSVGIDLWGYHTKDEHSLSYSVGYQQSTLDWHYRPLAGFDYSTRDQQNRWYRAHVRYGKKIPASAWEWGVASLLFYRKGQSGVIQDLDQDFLQWKQRDRWGAAVGVDFAWQQQYQIQERVLSLGVGLASWLTYAQDTQRQYQMAWDHTSVCDTLDAPRGLDYLIEVQGNLAWQSEKSLWSVKISGQKYRQGRSWAGHLQWSRAW